MNKPKMLMAANSICWLKADKLSKRIRGIYLSPDNRGRHMVYIDKDYRESKKDIVRNVYANEIERPSHTIKEAP